MKGVTKKRNTKLQNHILEIIPIHHQGSYKYACPPEADQIKQKIIMIKRKQLRIQQFISNQNLGDQRLSTLIQEGEPALLPVALDFFSPIFLTIKLVPMKMLEETARTSPVTLSVDIPM